LPASAVVAFPPGSTAATLTVPVVGDTLDEPNEAFLITASLLPGLGLGTGGTIQVTILDDDGRPPMGTPIAVLPFTISAQGNYWLVRNLSTPQTTGAAITINSDFVTVDLKGFKIGGGAAGPGTTAYGIHAVNRRNVTIRNGNIRGFYEGVFLEDTSGTFTTSQGHLVDGVRADGNTYAGIHVQGRGNLVRRSQIVATGGTTVLGADVDTCGIRIEGSGARVLNNDVTDTVGVGAGRGLAVSLASANGSMVQSNRLANAVLTASTGVLIGGSEDVLATGNRLAVLDRGIDFGASSGKYRNNLTSGVTTPYTGGTDAGRNH
jgi:Right handed beta helix region